MANEMHTNSYTGPGLFKEFQQFVELKELKILRPGKTFCNLDYLLHLKFKSCCQASWCSSLNE